MEAESKKVHPKCPGELLELKHTHLQGHLQTFHDLGNFEEIFVMFMDSFLNILSVNNIFD